MPSARAEIAGADVAVIGGGPAGAAAALALRRHLPAAAITVVEAGRHDADKPGEVLPGAAHALLDRLGVMPAFAQAGFVRGHSIASAWDGEDLDERHSVFSAQGPGWQLDRARFDRLLLDAAEAAGARVLRGVAVRGVERQDDGWRLTSSDGAQLPARAVVWATGRSWRLASAFGVSANHHDRLVAYTRFFASMPRRNGMVIEARPEGWWYSADLPDGRGVVTCMTDPDIGRQLDLRSAGGWHGARGRTRHMRAGEGEVAALARPAGTTVLARASGQGWVAAGDTLFAADPLSSRGIVHALRSGLLAAYAAADMLGGRDAEAGARLTAVNDLGFGQYRRALASHYAAGARWDTPFWQRRIASEQLLETA